MNNKELRMCVCVYEYTRMRIRVCVCVYTRISCVCDGRLFLSGTVQSCSCDHYSDHSSHSTSNIAIKLCTCITNLSLISEASQGNLTKGFSQEQDSLPAEAFPKTSRKKLN